MISSSACTALFGVVRNPSLLLQSTMNANHHLQFLQQHRPVGPPSGQLPRLAQVQMQQQRHLQQQRQMLMNQHIPHQSAHQQLQQQPQIPNQQVPPQGLSGNPFLAALTSGFNQNASLGATDPPSQALLSQPSENLRVEQYADQLQQHRAFSRAQPRPSSQMRNQASLVRHQMSLQQVPVIKDVWKFNAEFEFSNLRSFACDKTSDVYILIHQEIPGIVSRPVGTFKSSSDYHYQTLRTNADLLNIIQLSLCCVKIRDGEVSNSIIWQFNFAYDIGTEMYNEEHLSMLSQSALIHFNMHKLEGIPHSTFAELFIESGLLLDPLINWLSYHSGYDLGFLVSLLTNDILPTEESEFFWWCIKYFPSFYDLKYLGSQLAPPTSGGKIISPNQKPSEFGGVEAVQNVGEFGKGSSSSNKPSVEYLAEELNLLPISPLIRQFFTANTQVTGQHQQMTSTLHAYLLMECFKELLNRADFDLRQLEKFKAFIWGLGPVSSAAKMETENSPSKAQNW